MFHNDFVVIKIDQAAKLIGGRPKFVTQKKVGGD